jgi:hypothetical protein
MKKVKNGISYNKNGWTYISIFGNPYERGFAYGELIFEDIEKVKKILDFMIYQNYGVPWSFFIDACKKYFIPKIKKDYLEFYDEMRGFADGCSSQGISFSVDESIAWNNYMTLTDNWWNNMPKSEQIKIKGISSSNTSSKEGGAKDRCSAFMAVGDWTKDGKILVAHNNFSEFLDGQLARYIIDIQPSQGHRILMLGFPGWIWSGTDFFVTSQGIIGTETTIGGFLPYENKAPISCRIRQAMQYGNSLEDYVNILLKNNSGDYANSWLFGDIHSNEILRLELGLKYHLVEKTKNGYFIGFNAAYDPRIRNLECVDSGFDDIRRHQGSRRVRLTDLMEKNKGKLDVSLAKKIIADHYDVYLNKINKCSRTVCSHYELDKREFMSDPSRPKPYEPRGAVDGNICDTNMAKNMSFLVRWGSSCGTPFYKDKFCNKNKQWKYLQPYLEDRPTQPWTSFSITTQTKKNKTKKIKLYNNDK